MAASPMLLEPISDADKLNYEIFSILESKFLSGCNDPKGFLPLSSLGTPVKTAARPFRSPGKVRILSIDASTNGLLAAASLVRLESSIRHQSGDPSAQIADYFDLAAGSGIGGLIVAFLFTRGPDGRPLFSAADALSFLLSDSAGGLKGFFRRIFRRSRIPSFRKIFGDATLRDTVKPVLIPCYDLRTGAPFLFSRADAVEADAYDFMIREVCAATCAGRVASEMRSVDGRTCISAVGGGLAMPNPAASAITHVLHNKHEFPFATTVEDLIVVSLGSGELDVAGGACGSPSTNEAVRIAGNGMADMVDQALGLSFVQHHKPSNYVRIQAQGIGPKSPAFKFDGKRMRTAAEEMLAERNGESVLFRGTQLSKETNAEKLERLAGEFVEEQRARTKCPFPTVVVKRAMTPRSSSATTATAASSSRSLGSP